MIFANGSVLPDSERSRILSGLEEEINTIRMAPPLSAETVIDAVDKLGKRLASGEFDALLRRFLPAGTALEELLPLLRRETLEAKLTAELGPEPFGDRTFAKTSARRLPLGTVFHIAPGNMPGLPVYTVLEGLLTGNVNLVKLPHADKGLSLAAFRLLVEQEPRLAPYIYAFDLSSGERADLERLASLADGIVTWGGDEAVKAARSLAPAGCKLIEWGHRLSFAYISGYEDKKAELQALAEHIIATKQYLCSSCQVIFLDTENWEDVRLFPGDFLPQLEKARIRHRSIWASAQAGLSKRTALLEHIIADRFQGEMFYQGMGCSMILCPDRELELSPMDGNILVKALPKKELLSTLRRKKGYLQTAGLICSPEKRGELTALLARAGVTRITRAGTMSASFPGEGHDGEYPLRRYTRVVDIES